MIAFPNAKINLGLYIIAKRPDGFHNLSTVFYPVGWADALEIIPSKSTIFQSSGLAIPDDGKSNLCLRAYELLAQDFSLPPVTIHLHKVIPTGAGLGGGSADAAFTLKLLNQLFSLDLSEEVLENYARKLGSDCAFFIRNRACLASEKGDVFQQLALSLKGKYLVLIYPNLAISTAEAYSGVKPAPVDEALENTIQKPLEYWKDALRNDFEKSIFPKYPLLPHIKANLYEAGAIYASMSGSGSTIYGIFEQKPSLAWLKEFRHWEGVLE